MSGTQGALMGGGVKSVQRGVATASTSAVVNIAITSVNMSKSFITSSQMMEVSGDGQTNTSTRVSLTSATNVQLAQQAVSGAAATVAWEVVELY
jgi:hypothetical protein